VGGRATAGLGTFPHWRQILAYARGMPSMFPRLSERVEQIPVLRASGWVSKQRPVLPIPATSGRGGSIGWRATLMRFFDQVLL
jgi:hypothetical protein